MGDQLAVFSCQSARFRVSDVAFDEGEVWVIEVVFDVFFESGGEVVQADYFVSLI